MAIVGAVLSVIFGVIALEDHRGGPWPFLLFIVAIIAAVVTVVAVADVRPLTEGGRAARDHLEGLRLYIRLAEADRLRVLQSPSGALRVAAAGMGTAAAAAETIGGAPHSRGRAPYPTRPRC